MDSLTIGPGSWNKLVVSSSSIYDLGKQFSERIASLYVSSLGRPQAPGIPRSRLPKPKKIYGRKEFVTQIIDKIIVENVGRIMIIGPPGVGKSAIGVQIIRDVRISNYFDHRRHWINFNNVATFDAFLDVLSRDLSFESDGREYDFEELGPLKSNASSERLSAILSAFKKMNTSRLVLLDDFENIWDKERHKIEPILQELSNIPHLTLMITMRGALIPPPSDFLLELPTLSPRDAKLLFITVYPYSDSTLDQLLARLDYLPLAVVLVAHACQINGVTPAALTERWNNVQGGLLDLEDEALNPLEASIGSSMSSVTINTSPHASKLLRILTMLPAGILADDLAGMAPSIGNPDEVAQLITKMSLASLGPDKRMGLLSPIRSYILKYHQLDDVSRKELYFYHFKLAEEGLRSPGDCLFPSKIKKLVNNQRNIEAILVDALENGCSPAIEAALHYSSARCAIKPRIDILAMAVDSAKAEEAQKGEEQALSDGSMTLTARCLQRLGEIKLSAGLYSVNEHFKAAMDRYEKLGDNVSIARCEISISHGTWINHREDGIVKLEETRDKFLRLGDTPGLVECELKLGDLYLKERVEDARASCNKALSLSKTPYEIAKCQRLLSSIYVADKKLNEACSILLSSLTALRDFGDRTAVAECLKTLSSLYLREGRLDDAMSVLRETINEFKYLGQDLKVAFCQWDLGNITEDDEEAIQVYQLAIPQFWASAFTFAGAECRLDLGLRYIKMGQMSDALINLEIARPELQANRTMKLATYCLLLIIDCLCANGNIDAAKLTVESNEDELRTHFADPKKSIEGVSKRNNLKFSFENGQLKAYEGSDS